MKTIEFSKPDLEVTVEGKVLTVKQPCFTTVVFEIVDKPPVGYSIWNIGRNMPSDYIPYCQGSKTAINTRTLKAVKKRS